MQNKATENAALANGAIDIRKLTDAQFLTLGLPNLVYVRKASEFGEDVFALYAANGQLMGTTEDCDMMRAAIDEHALVAGMLH
ncbi:hypothetical protein [Acetobacter conturbans]|uniref:DUF1150 family protein n=1 Tax=Acetobacter conturbans TaxID=1737472 RepID=A0ABX0K0T5_9PROT|nr:hypothetical protein [Acetobacter conturbans]NHN89201.1 hypothetical protein [Acetobacter conturbans]